MAKVALLIGISKYKDFPDLPGTQTDIRVMRMALQEPQIGGFDSVQVLINPNRTDMERAIETLFSENRQRDDLVLLYFSGHGVRDDNGALYFATTVTEKSSQGRVRTSTAVSSAALQTYMSQSRSKRQVLILDCCFSGAFANDMRVKGDEPIDVKSQLGREGRAILTSSNATQVSYEKEGISIYTRYLFQGLASGAADQDGDGQITIDELHEYAKEKVQEAAPTMQPEIYAAREGYKIQIAHAPQGDPKLVLRREVNERARQKRGKLSPIDQRAFRFRAQELDLSIQVTDQIFQEVLQPYRVFWEKVEEFERTVQETCRSEPQLSAASVDDLRHLQRILKLRDEDIAPIFRRNNIPLAQPSHNPQKTVSQQDSFNSLPNVLSLFGSQVLSTYSLPKLLSFSALLAILKPINTQPDLHSSPISPRRASQTWTRQQFLKIAIPAGIGVAGVGMLGLLTRRLDYSTLESLLQLKDWRGADEETLRLMLRVANREKEGWLDSVSLESFPCKVWKRLDELWVQYSNGKFGFSVQTRIWQEVGSPTEYNVQWEAFGDRVGWRKEGIWQPYTELRLIDSYYLLPGELPLVAWASQGTSGVVASLALRYANCGR
jgi:uncharacterized caspase-like protein